MTKPLPVDCRLLLAALVRGPGADHVIGDIHERFADDLSSGMLPSLARRRARRQVIATIFTWWRPSAARLRRRGWRVARPTRVAGTATTVRNAVWGIESWLLDIRIAARGLRRRLRLSLAVVFTLGLGIGATTTIFSVVNGVLLRPLPFEDPARLVAVGTTFPGREWTDVTGLQHLAGTSMLNYLDFKERARSFEDLAAIELTSVLLPDRGDGPELVPAPMVSEEFFRVLRVSPALGRFFLPEEYRGGDESAAVITYSAWQQRFGGDPATVGSTIERVGAPVIIVGVLPQGFRPPETILSSTPDFWLPLQPNHPRYASRGRRSLYLLGRLKSDVSVEQARTEMQAIADQLAIDFPDGNVYPNGTHFGAGVNGLLEETVGATGRALRLFLGAAALLLAISALNAATMLLARTLDRLRELGVRVALGASRARMFRFLLMESVLLSAMGGAFGLLVAFGGVEVFLRSAPVSIPRTTAVIVDGRVVLLASLVSIVSGLTSGMLPALRHARLAPGEQLRSTGGRSLSASEGRLRSVLVAGQMALAVVLVAGAALLANSLLRIQSVTPGFNPDGLTSMRVGVKRPGAPEGESAWEAWDLLLREVEAVPGVTAFGGTTNPPYQDPFWAPRMLLEGEPAETERSGVAGYAITPGYLETVGTRLLAGRDISAGDGPDDPPVVLVNEAFVRQHLGGRDPLGVGLRQVESDHEISLEIVGVVENVIQARTEDGMRPAVYFPYTQTDWPLVQVVVRSDLPPDVLAPELRKAAARFSPYIPPADLRTMEARMAATWTTPRFQAMLFGSFAITALLLAAAGLYGSLSHSVGRRQRELGIRMALGAKPSGVLKMVIGQGVRLSVLGVIVGIGATLALTRMLEGFLYDLEPTDPATLAATAVTLALVAVIACLLPAHRATRVDPVEVLRAE